ncbi:hypothetical protein K2173_004290 [Erythroxylum novogranatense]|uniref:Avr9/Cf-9 rapidly elicited protein 146 n=1 Tax=Erythroxylum novogranatense TaxID=1862640 RepID=A0AAV8U694_9ROSI|nr:hypothetical protein K2173_004290 [Erythroxylum novogranatense]
MTRNLPIVARRVWRMIRVLFFMLQKGISKRKLLVDLNTMLKRGNEIAAKAIGDLMFHHHHHDVPSSVPHHEYEFSCSNTPTFNLRFHVNKRRSHHHKNNSFFACAFHTPQTHDDDVATMSALELALEMLNSKDATVETATASPVLPGFGKSPMVRKLRITDSPFPLTDVDDDNGFVDKKAEEFIERFYKELSLQSKMSF